MLHFLKVEKIYPGNLLLYLVFSPSPSNLKEWSLTFVSNSLAMNVSNGISLPLNIQQPLKIYQLWIIWDMGIKGLFLVQSPYNIWVFTVRVFSEGPSPQHTICWHRQSYTGLVQLQNILDDVYWRYRMLCQSVHQILHGCLGVVP